MDLNNLLNTKSVEIEGLGKVEIRELSHKAQMLVIYANRVTIDEKADDPLFGMAGPLTVKYALGLEESADEIAEKLPLRVVQEIASRVNEFVLESVDADDPEDLSKN